MPGKPSQRVQAPVGKAGPSEQAHGVSETHGGSRKDDLGSPEQHMAQRGPQGRVVNGGFMMRHYHWDIGMLVSEDGRDDEAGRSPGRSGPWIDVGGFRKPPMVCEGIISS